MSPNPELLLIAKDAARLCELVEVTFCGKGAFKETYRAVDKDGNYVALKLSDRSRIGAERTQREIAALKRCNSPRIARLFHYRVYRAAGKRTFDLILEEYFDGGTLESRLLNQSLDKPAATVLTGGLLLAVDDLRKESLVHRDIKPANIMYRGAANDPVLVDFGLVRDLADTSLTASWLPHGPGTPFYSSPEQLNNEKHLIDWRSDQFSIAVTVYQSLFGAHPYQMDTEDPTSAVDGVVRRTGPTDDCKKLLTDFGLTPLIKMLAPWPVQRFTTPKAAIEALNA